MKLIKQIPKKIKRWMFVVSVGLVLGVGVSFSIAYGSYLYIYETGKATLVTE